MVLSPEIKRYSLRLGPTKIQHNYYTREYYNNGTTMEKGYDKNG